MAYSTTSRYRRKPVRKGRYTRKLRTPRRSYAKRRSYVRKPRTMSRKSLLNITSEKKRDKMLNITNSTASAQSGSGTYINQPAVVIGGSGDPALFIWCATARDNTRNTLDTTPGTKFDVSTRTASSCYMVGLKEAIEIQVGDGLPWQWRRICVTLKGKDSFGASLTNGTSGFYPALETSNGYTRLLNQVTGVGTGTGATGDRSRVYALLFQGQYNQDWLDPITAKVDNERLSVKYDKVTSISSGNEDGVIRKYNRWHAMRHNLEYDDDERGGGMTAAGYSVTSKKGMGDYWIIDIFRPRVGSTTSNQLLFGAESTLYWHER